ncbi:MAG: hypothetical protein ACRDRW_22180 [Pseudonocardiaceae bacterium]
MEDNLEARRELLRRIQARRASINTYVREKQPVSNRLANISIVSSAIAAALTAGPAVGGVTFARAVQNGLGWAESSSVWRLLCFTAVVVSLAAAISTNLNKSNDLTARIGVAESCNADLEGLCTLVEFGELSVKDAAAAYRQLVAKVPFIGDASAADANAYFNDAVGARADDPSNQVPQWRRVAFLLPAMATVFAGLVLLITMVGLFIGLSGGATAAPPPRPPSPSTTTDASLPRPSVLEGVFTGRSSDNKVTLAIATKGDRAAGYLCDGKKIEAWMEGTATGNQVDLRGNNGASVIGARSVDAIFGTLTIDSVQLPYSVKIAGKPAGLYEGRGTVDGVANRIGWIVLPDGSQVGIRNVNGKRSPAPRLDSDKLEPDGVRIPVNPVGGDADVVLVH